MYFSVDSVPNEQLTLDRSLMDDSNKEDSPEPAQLQCFGKRVRAFSPQDYSIQSSPHDERLVSLCLE